MLICLCLSFYFACHGAGGCTHSHVLFFLVIVSLMLVISRLFKLMRFFSAYVFFFPLLCCCHGLEMLCIPNGKPVSCQLN